MMNQTFSFSFLVNATPLTNAEVYGEAVPVLHVFALSISEAEMVVGWARSHYLSAAVNPSIKGDKLIIPRER